MTATTRDQCVARDREDPLRGLRDEFVLPEGIVYLDGNSLGARPRSAEARAAQVITEEWGVGLIRSWNTADWFELPQRLGDKIAPLVGAKPGEVVVTDTTSINLFKVLAAALRVQAARDPARKVIVSERSNFPTDLYIAQGLADLLQQGYELRLVDAPEQIGAALGADTAVLMVTEVNYRTGHLLDMRAVTAQAHEKGVLTVWDLCHSAGALPIDLHAAGADYVIGCTYKYLNGGPGSPAFVWVAPALREQFWQPLSGWWGHEAPFEMAPGYRPAQGVDRYKCGTQAVVSLALVECGLDIFARTDMHALRAKSLALTDLFIELVESRCARHPLTLVTPRDHARRGSQVSIEHPQGFSVMAALIERGVIGDYREPRILRFGFTPLYIGYADVWDAVEVLRDVLDSETWKQPRFQVRSTVT
ncbi:MAG: Kynureninase [Burkholderiaceae bacterium]|nr:MAG: Kynureninase [Burkholderiaceae bacterium]